MLELSSICDQHPNLLLHLFLQKCHDSVWLLSLGPLSTVIFSSTSERTSLSRLPCVKCYKCVHTDTHANTLKNIENTNHPLLKAEQDARIRDLIDSFTKQCWLFQHVFQVELCMWHANLSEHLQWKPQQQTRLKTKSEPHRSCVAHYHPQYKGFRDGRIALMISIGAYS